MINVEKAEARSALFICVISVICVICVICVRKRIRRICLIHGSFLSILLAFPFAPTRDASPPKSLRRPPGAT